MCEAVNKNLSAESEIGFHLFSFFIFHLLMDLFKPHDSLKAPLLLTVNDYFSSVDLFPSPEQKLHLTSLPCPLRFLACLPWVIQGPVDIKASRKKKPVSPFPPTDIILHCLSPSNTLFLHFCFFLILSLKLNLERMKEDSASPLGTRTVPHTPEEKDIECLWQETDKNLG